MLVLFQFAREYGKPNPVLKLTWPLVDISYMWCDCVHHDFITFTDVQHSFTPNHPMGEIGSNPKPRIMSELCSIPRRIMKGIAFILGHSLQNAPCGIRREK